MERYSRQVVLGEIGEKGQSLLLKSKVAVVGAGATGSRASELLSRAGVGEVRIIDRDTVELGNLQRQAIYTEKDIGKPKALVIEKRLKEINSAIRIKGLAEDLDHKNVHLLKSDLVLDCTDNLQTRFLINEYCRKNKIPWIYSAAIGTKGSVMAITPKAKHCFRCVFEETTGLDTCETAGILNTAPAMAASMQVTEAIKILTRQESSPYLIMFGLWKQNLEKIRVRQNPKCPVCKGSFECLAGRKEDIIKFCGTGNYQIKGKINSNLVKNKLKKIGKIIDMGQCFQFKNMTVFKDRVLIKAKSKTEARKIYSKHISN